MIVFPSLESWNSISKVATIVAQIDKKRVLCRISPDILVEKFGASEDEPMQSVKQYRAAIQAAATHLIEQEIFEEDGSVTIRASDL